MHARRALVRAAVLGVAVAVFIVLVRVMGPGTRTVAVGALCALVALWCTSFTWSSRDALRSPVVGPVIICWLEVVVLLLGGYVVAALLLAGSYAQEMPLPEIVISAVAPAVLCLVLPSALGIAVGRARRRSAARQLDQDSVEPVHRQ